MFIQRVLRILIFLLVVGGLILVAQRIGGKEVKKDGWQSLGVPAPVVEKAEELEEEVLGVATKILPISKKSTTTVNTKSLIEEQANQILETIKKLPETEAKKIKRELILDFCQQALED